jgi:hypothetical protein
MSRERTPKSIDTPKPAQLTGDVEKDEQRLRVPNVQAGTLTLRIGSPVEHLGELADRMRLFERLFVVAANCTDVESIASDDESMDEWAFYTSVDRLVLPDADEPSETEASVIAAMAATSARAPRGAKLTGGAR